MNTLLETHVLLEAELAKDSWLCLASTICWLDPMWCDEADVDWYAPQDEDGTLTMALHITRQIFPGIYLQAVEALREGADYAALDRLICDAVTAAGIPLDEIEGMGFGIPMPAYGAVLEDPDFYSGHPDVLPVLACFGVSPGPNPYHIDVPDCVYTAGRLIAADLQGHEQPEYRQLSWLMQWLTSCSGNSSIDFSYEEICEFQPLSWERDEFEFAVAIIEEADGIMVGALEGLAFINRQPEVMAALQNNVRRIYKAIEKQKGKNDEPRIRLAWPHLAGGTERTTEPVA